MAISIIQARRNGGLDEGGGSRKKEKRRDQTLRF